MYHIRIIVTLKCITMYKCSKTHNPLKAIANDRGGGKETYTQKICVLKGKNGIADFRTGHETIL